ncbi:SymE family type I addiction module toxin [Dyadobacter sp. MSC1_007]|jgi:toxic protein SymE|uniref:SymE family type I addiction module toxin n=1 Tax=Dyadobacter sp. MSC1_007 TaxID=2909264 RepID=UPI00202F2352|nr:SymE family type I addiction module toxin [Dyadobacter sp. MSC1_007]
MQTLPAKERRLKIYSKFRQNAPWESRYVPEIRLNGKWLEDLGFDYGESILVKCEANRIVIETLEEE